MVSVTPSISFQYLAQLTQAMHLYYHQYNRINFWLWARADLDGYWTIRFHRDDKSWLKDRNFFVDYGREMPDAPTLLKSRDYLKEEDAIALWKALQQWLGEARTCLGTGS